MMSVRKATAVELCRKLWRCTHNLSFAVVTLTLVLAMRPIESLASQKTYSVVAMGTSLTARATWPDALAHALTRCLDHPVRVSTIAQSGATSEWGLDQASRVAAMDPDVVLIEFATNDASVHRLLSRATSRHNLEAIISVVRDKRPGVEIYVMAMNPVSGLRGLIRPDLASYEAEHQAAALAAGAKFIDHRPKWNQLAAAERELAIPDGLHPTPEVATKIMIPLLLENLAPRGCPHRP